MEEDRLQCAVFPVDLGWLFQKVERETQHSEAEASQKVEYGEGHGCCNLWDRRTVRLLSSQMLASDSVLVLLPPPPLFRLLNVVLMLVILARRLNLVA
ncbi:hypothetical protein K1719_003036 [Acacia pycnantha]|nr:hypothetical protein K1719_003036 [Acacia pycnantha]